MTLRKLCVDKALCRSKGFRYELEQTCHYRHTRLVTSFTRTHMLRELKHQPQLMLHILGCRFCAPWRCPLRQTISETRRQFEDNVTNRDISKKTRLPLRAVSTSKVCHSKVRLKILLCVLRTRFLLYSTAAPRRVLTREIHCLLMTPVTASGTHQTF